MDDEQDQRRRGRRRRSNDGVNGAGAVPVRLARLVRAAPPAAAIEAAVVIELGEVRVSVGRDADPALVATVLALVGGAR